MRKLSFLAIAFGVCSVASAQSVGPSPYLQTSDGPWTSLSFNYFHLENFEDGLLNVPGVVASTGSPIGPGGLTDSVDGDDGAVDGSGTNGHSFFSIGGSAGISFTFSAAALGALPTHAGIVWTDGVGTITFEAFDQNNVSLGTTTGNHADGSVSGTTAEDRFYGWVNSGGISKISIKNSGGGIEVDHLQDGASAVPEPATMLVGLAGLVALARRRK